MTIESINRVLAVLTLASHLLLLLGLIGLLFPPVRRWIIARVGQNGFWLAFIVALVSTGISLFYSNIAGFEPCRLCWWQRIFMYPQIVILGLALLKKDYKIVDYALALAMIGAIIALYHNYIYFGGPAILPCEASGLGVSCSKRYVFEFGYITIPMMSLTSFLLMIFSLGAQKTYNQKRDANR